MKRSFKERYHLLIIGLFGIIALELLLLLVSISSASDLNELSTDLQSIIIIFFFVIFVYLIVIYNYIPFRLHKALKEVRSRIDQVTNGNNMLDFDPSLYDQDGDIQDLISSLKKMLDNLNRFDQVKVDKIFEHHQRIQQLIGQLPQSILITSINGDVIYCNVPFRSKYPSVSEMTNINDLIFKDEYNRNIFEVMLDSLRYGNNLSDARVIDAASGRIANIDGSIIRNRKGDATGSVFVLNFIDEITKD